MKNAKRLVIVILSAVLVLTLIPLALSACETDTLYTVTVAPYNDTQGHVDVSKPASGDKYEKGETVTVTVTPAGGYEVSRFVVSGHSDAKLTNGEYSFTVKSDTTITVAFRKNSQDARCSVTTVFNSKMGSVSVSKPADGGNRYVVGESVTVTASPIANYIVKDFSVSGHDDAQLVDGKYTFTVEGDTTVSVIFQLENMPKMTEEMLEPLRGSVLFDGWVDEIDFLSSETFTSDMTTLFDGVHKATWLQEWYMGRIMYNVIYHDVDGKAAILQHNESGKLASETSDDDFVDFFNPFDWLTADDIEYVDYVDYGEWCITDLDKAAIASTAITGYTGKIDNFQLYVENGVVTQIIIRASRISHPDFGMDYQDIYYFEVAKRGGEATMPDEWFAEEYPTTPEHEELKKALQDAYQAENYTVHYFSHEEGFEDLEYDVFATPDGIYENDEGWEGGYIERVDGGVWWFSYDTETQGFDFDSQPLEGVDNLYDIFARFDLNALDISYSMLESKGDGVFELRFIDAVCENSYTIFAGAMAVLFGTGYDQRQYFATAIDFRVSIRDGVLYQVEFNYNYYGYITEYVVLTFSNFNNTEFPIEVTDDAFNGTFSEEYIGSWMDEAATTTVIVTLDKLTVNGQQIETVEKVDNGYSFTYNNKQYTLSYRSNDNSLALKTGNVETLLYTSSSKWTKYIGVYQGESKGITYTVIVSEQGVVVIYDGKAIVSQSVSLGNYAGFEYLIFVSNGVDFGFEEDEQGQMNLYSDEKLGIDVYVERVTLDDCAHYNYVGLYRYTDLFTGSYEIAITPDTIYITVDGEQTKVTEFTYAKGELTFLFGDVNYCISNTSYHAEVSAIAFYPVGHMSNNVELDRVSGYGSVSFDKIMQGVWEGTEKYLDENKEEQERQWKIVITANSLTINGEQILSVEYVKFGIYDVYYNDMYCMLTLRNGVLYFTQGENGIFVELTKTGSVFDPSTSNWSKFIGTYEGEYNGDTYKIVITADKVEISINGVDATVKITDYDDVEGYFELKVNDGDLVIQDWSYDNPVSKILITADDYATYKIISRTGD